jgi:hypothetical protein
LYQEINRSDAFSYDNAEPLGMFVNNKIFFIPNAPKALLAYMNSTVASFFLHTMSGVPPGGFLALQLNIINPLPIPNWTERQQILLGTLADYLLWVHGPGSDALGAGTLLPSYLERWVNALVYELFFPEQLHVAGLYFFRLAEEAKLRPISEMKGGESDQLRNLFETAYRSDHPVRRALFVLDSLNEVRIIEGKA